MLNFRTDFVIITALEEELNAFLAKLPNYRKLTPTNDDIRTYFSAEVPITFSNGLIYTYKIITLCLLNMGRVEAANATGDAIRRWHPRYVILAGIAGGIAEAGVQLGDVIISDQLVDYELQKLNDTGAKIRYSVHRADPRLLGTVQNFIDNSWMGLIKEKRPKKGCPQRIIGPIATGDKVIAFKKILDKYRDDWPKIIGVEMEAGGVASASFQSAQQPGFLMVRGVSDLADEAKETPRVKAWRAYACDIAASFTTALIMSGPIPPLEEQGEEQFAPATSLFNTSAHIEKVTSHTIWLPKFVFQSKAGSDIPDVLTPGLSPEELIQTLTPHVGESVATRLQQLSESSIIAVEKGDYDLYMSVGSQIEIEAQGCQEIEASGKYLTAEGYRLKADFLEINPLKKQLLFQKAIEQYELSLERLPNNPSAFRGLARVYEIQGQYDKALALFEKAKGLALDQLTLGPSAKRYLQLSHEILRITRHHINCILDLRNANPQSIWNREHKRRQLEGYIVESENLHRENMPLFEGREQWFQIEWFMALIFLARAWGRLGNSTRMIKGLTYALWARRCMIKDSQNLTTFDRINLRWWLNIASAEPREPSSSTFHSKVINLENALLIDNTPEILCRIDDIIFPLLPPWQSRVS